VVDLRIGRTGVKRWAVKHLFHDYMPPLRRTALLPGKGVEAREVRVGLGFVPSFTKSWDCRYRSGSLYSR